MESYTSMPKDESQFPHNTRHDMFASTRSLLVRPSSSSLVQNDISRVCDRCIMKRVKCNLVRPVCSRCLETGSTCIYSAVKRRPGPSKGSRYKRSRPRSSSSSSRKIPECNKPLSTHVLDTQESPFMTPGKSIVQCSDPMADLFNYDPFLVEANMPLLAQLDVPSDVSHEMKTLDLFFTSIHPSVPLFDRDEFFFQYELGLHPSRLLQILVDITAILLKQDTDASCSDAKGRLATFAKETLLDGNHGPAIPTLDEFRQACLLSFFTFHQFPGQDSWFRIGSLSRKACQWGLHEIDNSDQRSVIISHHAGKAELEAWRRIWWCIFCLDSYSNITAGTPFVLEKDSISTGLFRDDLSTGTPDLDGPLFLGDTDSLWETVQCVLVQGSSLNTNLHIISTALLRETATVVRLLDRNPTNALRERLFALEDDLSAIWLALPQSFISPSRNVLKDECGASYHARLTCALHLHAARLYLTVPLSGIEDEASRESRWHRNLESCDDIVAVAKTWNNNHSLGVDPAICFIMFYALVSLDLHSRNEIGLDAKAQGKLERSKRTLLLYLKQFGSLWDIPKRLMLMYESMALTFPGSVSLDDVAAILRSARPTIHQERAVQVET